MRSLALLPLLLSAPSALLAEEAQPAGEEVADKDARASDIVVVATRIAGQVDTAIPPIMSLDEADISSYGAASIGELLEAVSPQTGSGRGRGDGHPVILLNGQRIANFRQLREVPPEAIRRMEVLPEEVALRFGYAPNQRVVNFILKDNFSTVTLAEEYNVPTRGGFAESELEAGLVRFDGPGRLSLNGKMEDGSLLTEAERGIIQPADSLPSVASDPEPGRFRSLIADSITHTVNGSWSTGLGGDGMAGTLTLDGLVSRNDARSLSGLDTVLLTAPDGATALRTLPGPLVRDVRADKIEGGVTLNKPVGSWQLTATVDASYADTLTLTDREADLTSLLDAAAAGTLAIDGPLPDLAEAGRDRAQSKLLSLSSLANISGQPFRLPAGEASLTVSAGYDHIDSRNSDTRSGNVRTQLKRDIFSLEANLALPITSRKRGVLGGAGDITFNLSGGIHDFSDFGTLTDWSAGLVWSPVDKLTLNASYIVTEVAPSVGQLGQPEILTFNVPVYDFTLGRTVLVTTVSGGNPALLAEKQRDIKLSANYELPLFRDSSLIVEYFRNSSDDVTRTFPLLTPAIEGAFPERVTRDASGRLIEIDRRPVTYSKVESSRLRWGLNLSGRVSKEQEGAGGGLPGFGGRGRGGRWNLAVYHTWRFTDRVTIAPGIPVFDQIAGDALTDGGVPRHSIELEGGMFHKGFGLRLNGNWSAPATVTSNGASGNSDLRFGSVVRLDARVFLDLGMRPGLVEKMPFLDGLRIAFDFDNIFDSRQKVTDGSGLVPLSYQRAYRDPRGRFAGIDIRKRF